jgi:hypothetical protein
MTDLDKQIRRGINAKQLLENELMAEAKDHIEAEFWRLFRELKPSDVEGLQFVKQMQYIHAKYTAFLNKAITDGKMAELQVESRKKSLRERVFG